MNNENKNNTDLPENTQARNIYDIQIEFIKRDVQSIGSDVAILKSDVAVIKSEVSTLKLDAGELKSEISELKTDIAVFKTSAKWNLKIIYALIILSPFFPDALNKILNWIK